MNDSIDISSISGRSAWVRRLKIKHLEIFLTLFESKTISEAAVKMHMTQSAMSHWLSDLEEMAGIQLVVRERRIRLTDAGEAFRRFAIRVLGDVARSNEELQSIISGEPETLRIGSVSAGTAGLVPKAIVTFQSQNSRVAVRLEENTLTGLIESLEKRELDVLVGALDERAYKSTLDHEVLHEECLVPIVQCGHPLTQHSSLSWSDLFEYPWIMPPPHTLVRAILDNLFLQCGRADLLPKVETSSYLATENILKESNYIAIASKTLANNISKNNVLQALPLTEAKLSLGVVWRRGDLPVMATKYLESLSIS
ncbi:LysR substrate-binding domain-containing protein [Zwartia sp.]|uniref:LysR substrate-binding domain-containing protein n=1 Tax=Zwartia sp. TaxID=2978004 RepID=UPI003BB20837